jgi:PAS domain S-box-containing protein
MAPEPDDRYRSPRALADDIERWLASDYERLEQAHRELQMAHDDLRAVQGSLAESEARYRQLTEGCLDAIVVTDRDGRITLFNPAAERTFEYTAAEILDHPLAELFASDLREEVTSALAEYLQTRSGRLVDQTVELRGRRKSGAPFPLELSLSAIEIAGSVLFMGAIRDQTERQRMRAKLAQSEKLASIGLLSAGVAHEINNPLANVGNNLAVLERDLAGMLQIVALYEQAGDVLTAAAPEIHRQIDDLCEKIDWRNVRDNLHHVLARAREGVQRVANIVSSLRGLATGSPAKREPFLISDLLESVLEMIRGRMRRSHIEIQVEHAPDVPRLSCVSSQISQVLLNLLINAVQAIESTGRSGGGLIRLTTARAGDSILLSVEDNGCGIEPAALSQLFDPFFTTRPAGKGTGLGLSIAHGIVRSYGGWIEVESEPGRGSCFRLTLPLPSS